MRKEARILQEEEKCIKVELLSELSGHLFPLEQYFALIGEDVVQGTVYPLSGIELVGYKNVIAKMLKRENDIYFQNSGQFCHQNNIFAERMKARKNVAGVSITVKEINEVLYGCALIRLKEFPKESELYELCRMISECYRADLGKRIEKQKLLVEEGMLVVHFGTDNVQKFRVHMMQDYVINMHRKKQMYSAVGGKKKYFRNIEGGR